MLGTRVIMMGMSDFPGPMSMQPEAEMICAANHQVPLFWLMAFTTENIELYEVQGEGDEILSHEPGSTYPLLMADKNEAVQLLQKRLNAIKALINESDQQLLNRWVSFLDQLPNPVIAIDTYELWCNTQNPDQLHTDLSSLLQQLTELEKQPVSVFEQLKSDGVWQANNAIGLAGFGW